MGLGLPDEAFLAGLIHDIGIMVEMQARRAKFVEMLELRQSKGLAFRAAEVEVLHAHHEHFGKELCKVWKFPGNLQLVSGHHHEPLSLPEGQRTLPALCYVADFVSRELEQGFADDVEQDQPDPAVLEVLKLGPKALDEVKQKLPDALKEAQAVFNQGG
jgi:HD-like signal output (HDOD) protein